MESKTLSPQALQVIELYFHLPFDGKDIAVPYYNNKRHQLRGALRVTVGKGTPEEIVDEAILFGLKEKKDIKNLNEEDVKKFLIDHNLGIDCSGLAYHILDAECHAHKKGSLQKHIHFITKNPLRKIITRLRAVENTGVTTLANDKNSTKIDLKDVAPGNIIIFLNAGRDQKFHHVLVVHQVDFENNLPTNIHYTHTLNWRTDGQYNHGIKQGNIEITDLKKPLTEQHWVEAKKTGNENETFLHATSAETLELRRLKC